MSALSIGLSGLEVNQRLLNLTGQNIANANTPGYANEVANLAEVVNGNQGAGVQITGVTRSVNQALQQAVNTNTTQANSASTQLSTLNQLQSFLATGTGTLHDNLVNLFTQLESLSANPSDPTQQQVVVTAANAVTTQLNGAVNNIDQLNSSLLQQANTTVGSINTLTSQIAQLNQQIGSASVTGGDANILMDQRDAAVSSLAALIDVQVETQPGGQINVLADGTPLVVNSTSNALSSGNDQGNLIITAADSSQPIPVSGGTLGGILTLTNTTLPAVQSQLDTFAQALTTAFDQIQSTGLGSGGPMTSLTGQRGMTSSTVPLDAAGLAYPPQAGTLSITVTNLSTGAKKLEQLSIDPKTQSLGDIASAINALPNMQASVNAQTGTLNLVAKPGYGFDFTGTVSSSPDAQSITGTTTPSISGQYAGTGNDTLTYTFVGTGTIGATPNLALQVTNSAGVVLGSVNVGQGYSPGTNIAGPLGINVNLAAGTANNGDSFSVNVTGSPDSANLLPALGLDSFFVGNSAGTLQVNSSLVNNPANLAVSTTGQAGDSSNLSKFVALQNQPVLGNQSQSLVQYLEGVIGSVGTQTANVQSNSTALTSLGNQLSTQLQNADGVDQNEALTQMVQYQQAFQMNAQFVNVVNQTITDLMNIFTTQVG
jgi:flagellar hook-associated protein FlgK